jgi:hypothetical protein
VSSATLDWGPIEVLGAEEAAKYESTTQQGDLIRVGCIQNQFEAELLEQALQEKRVWFVIEEHRDRAYSDLFVFQRGWGRLIVRRDQAEIALGELTTIRSLPEVPSLDLPEELRDSPEDLE